MAITLYELLGCQRTATRAQLRKGFLERAKLAHPDRGGNASDFDALKEAFDILSDPDLRKVYDARGLGAARGARDSAGTGVGESGARANVSAAAASLFSALFGSSRFSRSRRARTRVYRLRLSLEEIYAGKTVALQVRVRRLQVVSNAAVVWTTVTEKVDVNVARGARAVLVEGIGDDSVDAASGMSDAAASGADDWQDQVQRRSAALRGDVRFLVEELPHRIYRRARHDLRASISLRLAEALDSDHVATLPDLEGGVVHLHLSGVTKEGAITVVQGKGMPYTDSGNRLCFGDLVVVVGLLLFLFKLEDLDTNPKPQISKS